MELILKIEVYILVVNELDKNSKLQLELFLAQQICIS